MQNMMSFPSMTPAQQQAPVAHVPVTPKPRANSKNTPGYRMFVKSLTEEILKRNPNANQVEMRKIVDNEWVKLPDQQKSVYEKLGANQTIPDM